MFSRRNVDMGRINPRTVGAKEKRVRAQRFALQEKFGFNKDEKPPFPWLAVLFVLVASMGISFYLTVEVFSDAAKTLRPTPHLTLNKFLAGTPDSIKFVSDTKINQAVLIVARGLFIFVFTGLFPLFAALLQKATENKKINVHILTWAGILALLIFYGFFGNDILKLLEALLSAAVR